MCQPCQHTKMAPWNTKRGPIDSIMALGKFFRLIYFILYKNKTGLVHAALCDSPLKQVSFCYHHILQTVACLTRDGCRLQTTQGYLDPQFDSVIHHISIIHFLKCSIDAKGFHLESLKLTWMWVIQYVAMGIPCSIYVVK